MGGNTDRDGAQLQYGQQADKKQLCQIDADRLHHKREGKEDPLYDQAGDAAQAVDSKRGNVKQQTEAD